jgi:hypothetical protein
LSRGRIPDRRPGTLFAIHFDTAKWGVRGDNTSSKAFFVRQWQGGITNAYDRWFVLFLAFLKSFTQDIYRIMGMFVGRESFMYQFISKLVLFVLFFLLLILSFAAFLI